MVHEVTNLSAVRNGNCVLDFYTTTCAPCKALHPVLEEISDEFKDVTVGRVEVTKNPVLSQAFGIMSVPTVMVLQNGKIKEVSRGFHNKTTLVSMIRKVLSGS